MPIIAEVITPTPARTASGRKSRSHLVEAVETRAVSRQEMRAALKIPARFRPRFRILGLSGSALRLTALALLACALSAGTPAQARGHRSSGGTHHNGARGHSIR